MIEKSDLRELVFRLEHARKSLIGPKFRALGLPLGQGFLAGLPDPERSGNRKKSASDLFRC